MRELESVRERLDGCGKVEGQERRRKDIDISLRLEVFKVVVVGFWCWEVDKVKHSSTKWLRWTIVEWSWFIR